MKLPHCIYPNPKCCGADAVTQTFRHLWAALDGRIDMHNIDPAMYGAGLALASPGVKVGADSPRRQDKQLFWLYAPGMGNLPRFEEDCSKAYADRGGFAVVIRDDKSFDIVEGSKVQECTWTPAYRFTPDVGMYLYYDDYYALIDQTNITANRTYALPDQSGTIALTSDITAGGVIEQDGVQTGISGSTLDTTLESVTAAVANINTAGKRIKAEYFVSFEGASAKTLRLKWDTSTKFDHTLIGGAGEILLRWTLGISETGATGVVYWIVEIIDFLSGESYKETGNFTTDTTTTHAIVISGQLTNSGDDMDLKWYVVEGV